MKKFIEVLSSPVFNLFSGLILLVLLGCCISLCDAYDHKSGFYGALVVISLDVFSYGFKALVDKHKSKKESLGSE